MIWLDVPVLGSWAIVYLWGLPGSNAFCKCWLVLVLSSASLPRATLKLWGRGAQRLEDNDEWWHIMTVSYRYIWSFHREETNLAELLAPLVCLSCICSIHLSTQFALGCTLQAYISNGIAVGIMTVFVRVEEQEKLMQNGANTLIILILCSLIPSTRLQAHRCGDQENGAMLPRAFKSVLFLDVFGWVSQKGQRWIGEWTFYHVLWIFVVRRYTAISADGSWQTVQEMRRRECSPMLAWCCSSGEVGLRIMR